MPAEYTNRPGRLSRGFLRQGRMPGELAFWSALRTLLARCSCGLTMTKRPTSSRPSVLDFLTAGEKGSIVSAHHGAAFWSVVSTTLSNARGVRLPRPSLIPTKGGR